MGANQTTHEGVAKATLFMAMNKATIEQEEMTKEQARKFLQNNVPELKRFTVNAFNSVVKAMGKDAPKFRRFIPTPPPQYKPEAGKPGPGSCAQTNRVPRTLESVRQAIYRMRKSIRYIAKELGIEEEVSRVMNGSAREANAMLGEQKGGDKD